MRVVTFLKQHEANATTTATEDQASPHQQQSKVERVDFNLNIQEEPPTSDQLKSILEYIGGQNASKVVSGARDASDALQKLKQDAELFQRPVVVDWHQGKVAIGEDQSEILNLLKSVPKETSSV